MADVQKGKLAFFLVGSTLLITFSFYAYQIVYTPNILVDREPKVFLIEKGSTFRSVQNDLDRGGFVNDMVSFSFLARLMDYDKSIRPGLYSLHPNMTNLEAIRVLRSGEQVPVNIVINNVRLLPELGQKITKNTSVTPEEFDQALQDFIDSNHEGFTRDNILCMFIPNTYEVYFDLSADDLVERMNTEYNIFWSAKRKQKADSIGLTPVEVSILASIVRAEASKMEEAGRIAGLYLNRLRRNIPLQADPTLVFAVGDFALKRILNEHKQVDSPYNTYRNAGLPPGPINMPSIPFLDAVLNAEKHKYIYMCAREDFSGYHNFARTLSEHNQNASKYQRALTAEQRKGRAAAQRRK